MKITREVKIGITAVVTITLFIWMYSFLKGENLLTRTAHYYVLYDEINGLSQSNPIEISGYKVGVVQDIRFIDDGTGRLLVTLSLDKKMRIPVGSVAEITTATLIAGMKIQFIFSNNVEIYTSGDTLPGRVAESLLTKLEVELIPLKETITATILQLDSVIKSINRTLNPEFQRNIGETMENINTTTYSLAEALKGKEKEISETVSNLHTISEVFATSSPKIDTAISNLTVITDSLATSDFSGAVNRLRDAAANTADLLESLNKGEGSAGKIITDDSLYINLNESLKNLSILLEDMKTNPKRYVHFSLFGKK